MVRTKAATLSAAALLTVVAACSDSLSPGTRPSGVAVAFSTAGSGVQAAVSRAPNFDVVVSGPGEADFVIDTAQIVIREVELESALGSCESGDSTGTATTGCRELRVGPLLVALPLAGGIGAPFTATVPAGTYRSIELELHHPSEDHGDSAFVAAFVAAHPEFSDASVRVTGTYRGERFVFTSNVSAELEMEFAPAVVVGGSAANVTVHVDVASWFRDQDGRLIAPTAQNESEIANRIQASFRAFEDDDRDGDEG